MSKSSATFLITLSLCLTACNRGGGNNSAAAPIGNNAAVPAAQANSASAAGPAQKDSAPGVAIALDGEGLRAVETESGRTSLLAFGSPLDQALDGLNRIFGAPPSEDGTNDECGGGDGGPTTRIIQWANGFQILSREGKFSGWEIRQAGSTTMNGIGIGSTRAELDEAFDPGVEQSSLGTEFGIGEGDDSIGGLLSADGPSGRVTTMWAGHTCHFR